MKPAMNKSLQLLLSITVSNGDAGAVWNEPGNRKEANELVRLGLLCKRSWNPHDTRWHATTAGKLYVTLTQETAP